MASVASSEKFLFTEGSEPDWLTRHRETSLEQYHKLPAETSSLYSKYVDFQSIPPLESLEYPNQRSSSLGVPKETKAFLDGLSREIIIVHRDATPVFMSLPSELKDAGVIFTDLKNAISAHESLVRSYYEKKAVSPDEDKYAAFNNAHVNSGLLLYIPEGVEVTTPFRSIFLLSGSRTAVVANTIIIAEDGKATLLQEGYSENESPETSLFSEAVDVYPGPSSEVHISSIHDFGSNVIDLSNRKSVSERDSKVVWASAFLGSSITRSRLNTVLNGTGAVGENVEVVYGSGSQRFDLTTNLVHRAQKTTASSMTRGVMRGKSKSLFKGMIIIDHVAKDSRAYLAEHSMLIDPEAKSNAIPGLEISTNEVRATHAASVAQIDQDQIFYLMSRGLSRDEARKTITAGFLEPVIKHIAVREVRGSVRYLLEEKWYGERLPFYERRTKTIEMPSELEERMDSKDIFERHYKYR